MKKIIVFIMGLMMVVMMTACAADKGTAVIDNTTDTANAQGEGNEIQEQENTTGTPVGSTKNEEEQEVTAQSEETTSDQTPTENVPTEQIPTEKPTTKPEETTRDPFEGVTTGPHDLPIG